MEPKLKCILVDDEPHKISGFTSQLERICPNVDLVYTATSAVEGYKAIIQLAPDVVFIDVQMPNETGLEMLDRFSERHFYAVFLTGFREYTQDAIKRQAFDFLIKPVDPEEIRTCIKRIADHKRVNGGRFVSMRPVDHRKIELITSGRRHFVRFEDIYYVEASGSYSTLHLTHGRRITVSKNLKRIEEQLCRSTFCRVHNSHLVRLTCVSSMNFRQNTLTLESGHEVKMSTRRRDDVRRRLDRMLILDAQPKPLSLAADVAQAHSELS